MKLYLWQLANVDCTCYYGIVENDLESAREKVIEMLNKGKRYCVLCIGLKDSKPYGEMSYEEKKANIETQRSIGKEILIEFVNTTMPIIHERGVPFKRE